MRVYASTYANVFETTDGGATWSTLLSGFTALYAAPSRTFAFGAVPATVFLAKLDPALSQVIYSTYLWTGSVSSIALDGQGDVALAGTTASGSGIVMKVSANDNSVIYSTVLNGTQPNAIAVDAGGNAVIAGSATSLTVTKGAYQSAPPGACSIR